MPVLSETAPRQSIEFHRVLRDEESTIVETKYPELTYEGGAEPGEYTAKPILQFDGPPAPP